MIMDRPTHVIDPDGEVTIVLQNPNAPFAELGEDMIIGSLTHTLPEPSDDVQNPAEEIKVSRDGPTETFKKWKSKKNKKKSTS